LIPQITIGDILESDIQILPDGKVKLAEKTWIWVHANLEGNKAKIDFPVIFCSEASRWLEEFLNMRIQKGEKINVRTPLMPVHSRGNLELGAIIIILNEHNGALSSTVATIREDFGIVKPAPASWLERWMTWNKHFHRILDDLMKKGIVEKFKKRKVWHFKLRKGYHIEWTYTEFACYDDSIRITITKDKCLIEEHPFHKQEFER
jgi:hypothetical protein